MPTKAEIRKAYEARLAEHPKVKALRPRRRPKVPTKPGVPRLIAQAMQDSNKASAVAAIRRVMKYHRRVGDLARRRLKGEKIPLKEQLALIRQGENVERDFREAARSAARAARNDPATEAYAAAIAARPDDTEVLDNLPSFVSRSELAAIKYLGVEPEELGEAWDHFYTRHRQEIFEGLASGNINQALERVEMSAGRLEFPEAPRYLVTRGVLTLGGDGDYDAVPIVAAVVTAVVAVVLAPASPLLLVVTFVVTTVVTKQIVDATQEPIDDYVGSLTRDEFWTSVWHLRKAVIAKSCAEEAETKTQVKFGRNAGDDESDAFRHCYWNFRMAREIGVVLAKEFADAHENVPDPDLDRREMDLHNNQVGRDLAVEPVKVLGSGTWEGKSGEELIDAAYLAGQLIVLRPWPVTPESSPWPVAA